MSFADLPEPPYYVVTFASQRTEGDISSEDGGYGEMADAMVALAQQQPGYLGVESARGADGFGITNSFWRDEDSIRAWKRAVDHLTAQRLGREQWYERYHVRVGRIERTYGFTR